MFKKKEIPNQVTFGELLKKRREDYGLTVFTISSRLHIGSEYIKALESGDFNRLPEEVYAKHFLKTYSGFLDLDFHELLAMYQTERRLHRNIIQPLWDSTKPVKKLARMQFVAIPKILKNAFIGVFVIMLFSYLGFKVDAIIQPPALKVNTPESDALTSEVTIEVSGQTDMEAILTINGEQVLLDEAGRFFEKIDLQNGINIIKISSKKDHSKTNTVYRRVVLMENLNQE